MPLLPLTVVSIHLPPPLPLLSLLNQFFPTLCTFSLFQLSYSLLFFLLIHIIFASSSSRTVTGFRCHNKLTGYVCKKSISFLPFKKLNFISRRHTQWHTAKLCIRCTSWFSLFLMVTKVPIAKLVRLFYYKEKLFSYSSSWKNWAPYIIIGKCCAPFSKSCKSFRSCRHYPPIC